VIPVAVVVVATTKTISYLQDPLYAGLFLLVLSI
jgi:hypothetical protein